MNYTKSCLRASSFILLPGLTKNQRPLLSDSLYTFLKVIDQRARLPKLVLEWSEPMLVATVDRVQTVMLA